MAAIHKSTGRQTQVRMEGRRQKRSEKAESGKMVRPGPRSTQVAGNCWERQESPRVGALMMMMKKNKNKKKKLASLVSNNQCGVRVPSAIS